MVFFSVSEIMELLGGIEMPTTSHISEEHLLTQLVANVTRLFGATPFFKLHVLGPNKVSVC